MYNTFMNSKHFLAVDNIRIPPSSPADRWADWLRILFPLGALLNRSAPTDPVRGIALPDAELVEDASMISAYYLSFYE